MGETALTQQSLRAQIISDPAQAAALRALLGPDGAAGANGQIAIVMLDGDGLDAGRATIEFDNAPASASVPNPDARLARARADRGIVTDRNDSVVETTDGYRFEFADNQVRIDWPGREGGAGETTFVGNRALEGDGTEWDVNNGNFVLPNGAMFTLGFDDDGKIEDFTLVHGDSKVNVAGIGDGDPRIGRVRDGGLKYREDRVEGNVAGATYRMGGTNDGWSNFDVTWNAEQHGQNFGIIDSDKDGNFLHPFAGYVVDPNLKPEFGTQNYERMIRSEIEDVRSVLSGNIQSDGGTDEYGDLVADYMLGTSGTYDRYANELQSSVDSRQSGGGNGQVDARIQQLEEYLTSMFSGMPGVQPNFQQGMAALQQLMQLYAQAQGMQSDYQQASSNLRSYIPSAQRANQPQDMANLVEQIVNGVGQQRTGNQQQPGRLEQFDLARGGYQGRNSRGTQDSVARLMQHRMQTSNKGDTRVRANQTRGEVELNATQTAARLHNAISGIGTDTDALIKDLSKATGAERERLKEVYQELFGETVESAIEGDTMGAPQFQATLKSLLNSTRNEGNVVDDIRATQDAAALHEAMDSDFFNPSTWGTDEDKLRDVLTNRSPAEIKRISEIYEQTYGESLREAVKGETWDDTINEWFDSGFQDSLVHQLDQAEGADYKIARPSREDRVRTRATQAAMSVRAAVKGGGTDHQALINTLSGLSNDEKAELRTVYKEMYNTSLVDDIESDTSWNFEDTLVKLATNDRSTAPATELQATRDAAILHRTVSGLTTDDGDLQDLLTTRSPAQLRQMATVYQRIHGETAKDAIEGDTSGWYESALVHQLSLRDFE